MTATTRPLRSVLYIPGSKPRALDKARGLVCDAVIFDLEDAVSPDEKVAARETLAEALAEGALREGEHVGRQPGRDDGEYVVEVQQHQHQPCQLH